MGPFDTQQALGTSSSQTKAASEQAAPDLGPRPHSARVSLTDQDPYTRWRSDDGHLAELGEAIQNVGREIWIDIPAALADQAVAAWERDETGDVDENETCAQRALRHRAGSFALIGAALAERGSRNGATVSAAIDGWLIAHALDAADDRGLIVSGERPPSKGGQARFINVDLDIAADAPMRDLAEYLGTVGCVLHDDSSGDQHLLSFELAIDVEGLNDTCRGIVAVVDSLPSSHRACFDRALARTLNIGIETAISTPVVRVATDVVASAGRLEMGIAVTHYPSLDDTTGPFRFRHHTIE